jgi:tetratricopeptide (TPR) repeat protein
LKLGDNDIFTLQPMNSLATSYTCLRKFHQAYELLNECIEKSTIMNGKDHKETIRYMTTLGDAYNDDGRHDEAQDLFRECLETITNNDDGQYVGIISRLAYSCIEKFQYEEAEKLYKESLEKMKVMRGENHPQTIIVMMNLANVYEKQNKPYDQVEAIRKECLEKSFVIYGKDHLTTLSCMSNLAMSYFIQGKLDEAEKLYKEWVAAKTTQTHKFTHFRPPKVPQTAPPNDSNGCTS